MDCDGDAVVMLPWGVRMSGTTRMCHEEALAPVGVEVPG